MQERQADEERVVHNSTIVSHEPHLPKDPDRKISGGPKPPPEKRSH